ncbi:MAG: HAD family phosphatase [Cyanobacteria bacterium P01_F01_bin.150]
MADISIELADIDAIVFDLGGVIINICYENTIQLFSQLCGFDASQLYTQKSQTDLFDQYEAGHISSEDFRRGLKQILERPSVSNEVLDQAWNAMLLDIPRQRVDWLRKVGQTKRIFLLSNTNAIHKLAFDQIFSQTFSPEIAKLDDLFEKAYFSHLIGDRKPHPSVFKLVMDEQSLIPERTLFIDDSLQHVEGAKSVGLHTLHLTNGLTLNDISWVF